jgi:IS5 family transposase
MQELERMSATQRHTQQVPKYRELLRITGQVLESARQVVQKAAKVKGVEVLGRVVIDQLRQQIATYCDLGEKVIDQTRRRVLDGEQVPTDEKVYSIFEGPHAPDQAGARSANRWNSVTRSSWPRVPRA